MAAMSATSSSVIHNFRRIFLLNPKPNSSMNISIQFYQRNDFSSMKKQSLRTCSVTEKKTEHVLSSSGFDEKDDEFETFDGIKKKSVEEKLGRKKLERYSYLVAAIVSSLGFTSMAALSVYYRFSWQMAGGEFPALEMFGTFALSVGAAVGMELWARWAHRALWHDSLWNMHESHHRAREGPFEVNDVFAIINAAPAIALLSYGFLNKGLIPCLSFGAGLGITMYGMAYMFVHDGLVHRRFPVGPIANVPYLRRVAAAHLIHHSDKFDGVPYGLFLGPKELEGKVGGTEELSKEVQKRIKLNKRN